MKRFVLIVFLVALLAARSFADDRDGWGLGTSFYGGFGYGPGLLLKTPVLPLYWELIVSLWGFDQENEPYFAITISGDYHFLEKNFPKNEKFGWFLGGGIVVSHNHFDGRSGFSARIPFGIYFAPIKHFDLVFELAPGAGIITPADFSTVKPDYGVSGLMGVRYWF